jgi:hypothetical protein
MGRARTRFWDRENTINAAPTQAGPDEQRAALAQDQMGDGGHGQRAEERSRSMRRVEQAEAGGAGAEVPVGVDGEQGEIRHGEEAVEEGEGDEAREHEVVADEAQALRELLEHVAAVGRPDGTLSLRRL